MRRENQRLQTENQDLARELEAARERVRTLEQEVARLTRVLEAIGRGDAVDDTAPQEERTPGSVDDDDPTASPGGLLRALKASYEEALGEMDMGRRASDRERGIYMRALTQWRNKVNREFRTPIAWHVEVLEATLISTGYTMRLAAIDPKNRERLGDPFEITVPRAQARRWEMLAARDEADLFILRGTLTPAVRVNADRATRGPFDNPPLIGPFAEFGFTVESRSLMPAEEEAEEG